MKKIIVLIIIASCMYFSCATITHQEMEYLGTETNKFNVSSSVHHVDWLGIGVSGEDYAEEYERAVNEALSISPEGTTELVNLKAFKVTKLWPQIVGTGFVTVGSSFLGIASVDGDTLSLLIGAGISLLGSIFSGINIYEFFVIAEPN